jgi:hypothetical protein
MVTIPKYGKTHALVAWLCAQAGATIGYCGWLVLGVRF